MLPGKYKRSPENLSTELIVAVQGKLTVLFFSKPDIIIQRNKMFAHRFHILIRDR